MASVVHLTSAHPLHDPRILYRECASLAQAGHDVTLVSTSDYTGIIEGVRIVSVPKPGNRAERMLKTGRAVTLAAAALDADLYHLHDPELLVWVHLLRRKSKAVVFDMHEYLPGAIADKRWIHPWLRSPVAAVARFGERLLLHNTPVIFAEKSYRKHYTWVKHWANVLNFADVHRISQLAAEEKAERFTIGYIGGVSRARGSTVTLQALKILQDQGLDIGFECVGGATLEEQQVFANMVSSLGLKYVTLHGRMLQEDGLRIIASCHTGLAILQDQANYRESFPTKIAEYMALGIPVIASDFPVNREVLLGQDCGLCVPPHDAIALAHAIRTLHDSPARLTKMGENGRAAVRSNFAWAGEAEKLIAFYDRVLGASPNQRATEMLPS